MKDNSGKRYYNNGIENRMIKEGEPIPEGFVLGMCKRSKEDREASNRKRKETNLKKYGVAVPLQSKEIIAKVKQTNMSKYGVENVSKVDAVKIKRKDTFIANYGVENPMQCEEVRERLKETNLDRYGVENPFASEEIKEKIKATNIENLGVAYPMQSKEVLEKSKQTCLEHYGVMSPLKSEEIKSKVEATNIKNLGVAYPFASDEIRDKSKNTLLNNYGVENPMYSDVIKDRVCSTNLERYGVPYNFQSKDTKEKVSKTCMEKYGVAWACMRPEARIGSNNSEPNRRFSELFTTEDIEYEREFVLERYSYDFKVGNILIEINPTATHNLIWNPFGKEHKGISEEYHLNKTLCAEKYGYRCIHVFEWDDINKVIKLLKKRDKVYARDCDIREVSIKDTNIFLIDNHLQGTCRGQDVRLGLYYNDELVSIMTFGKPRYNKNYEWELLRYCSSKYVVGGEGKLFNEFLKYNPKSIISYCDKSKFNGSVYKYLGFRRNNNVKPSKHWYSIKEGRHITDNLLRQRGYDQLFKENYGKGTSNEELMVNRGYLPVMDCGQDVWIYE